MVKPKKYVLEITGGYTVSTLPMERLAQYMVDLATMLGSQDAVHFIGVVEGSVALVHTVDESFVGVIAERARMVSAGTANVTALSAARSLNKKLREDNSQAVYKFDGSDGERLVEFPGASVPQENRVKGVGQSSFVDGYVVKIGGISDDISITILEADVRTSASADIDMAKRLGKHIYADYLRVYGEGRWERSADGVWGLRSFRIKDFDVLGEDTPEDVFADLRRIDGGNWNDIDLWKQAHEIRSDVE